MGCCCSKASADGPVAAPQSIELTEKGPDVAVKKSLISGTGVAYSSNTIEQDAAYWEVVVETAGPFRIGVARALKGGALAGSIGDEEKSWALAFPQTTSSYASVIGWARLMPILRTETLRQQ